MVTVRYTAEGGTYRVGGHNFEPGDEREVDAELADHLAGVDDFEVVDDGDDVGDEDGPPDGEDDVETCDAVKSDGEVCGRDLPCPYHGDEDGDDETEE